MACVSESGVSGLEVSRVAEVIVSAQDGAQGGAAGRRGSGYLVGSIWVLTAAHVVAEAKGATSVRFEADRPGEWCAGARVVLENRAADIALLEITQVPTGLPRVDAPRYAAVPEADVVLPFGAVGFPRFKIRQDAGASTVYRDSAHISGTVSVLSNRREGTLELAVPAPPDDAGPEHSPWEGTSGATVWCGDAVIGVVSAHHRSDGLGRLAAGRVERWYEALTAGELDVLARCAGLPPRASLDSLGSLGGPPAVPSTASLPGSLSLRELAELVDALTELPTLRTPNGIQFVLDSISSVIGANAPRDSRLRLDIFGIVRTCLRYRGTLDQFLEAIRLLEGDSVEIRAVDGIVTRLGKRYG